jgi:hypothetical protein
MDLHNTHLGDLGVRTPWDEVGVLVPSTFFLSDAPIMSRYTCMLAGSQAFYVKVANTGAATDWVVVARAGGTVSGDLIVTGTLTAGDIVIAP